MYYFLMVISKWVVLFSMLFSLTASTIKANIKKNRGKLPKPLKIMWFHLLCASFLQIIMLILSLSHKNNMLLVHMYIVEEFTMDMLFYRELLQKNDPNEEISVKYSLFIVVIVAFIAFAVVNAAFITDTNHFPIYTFAIQSIITVICAIKYSYVRSFDGEDPVCSSEMPAFKLYKGPVFWMSTGKLIYFFFALPLFIICIVAMENKEQNTTLLLWTAQNILLAILHIFMGIGFLKFTGNPLKVRDFWGYNRFIHNKKRRKRFVTDPDFAKRLKEDPDEFEYFKEENPDLFD